MITRLTGAIDGGDDVDEDDDEADIMIWLTSNDPNTCGNTVRYSSYSKKDNSHATSSDSLWMENTNSLSSRR